MQLSYQPPLQPKESRPHRNPHIVTQKVSKVYCFKQNVVLPFERLLRKPSMIHTILDLKQDLLLLLKSSQLMPEDHYSQANERLV